MQKNAHLWQTAALQIRRGNRVNLRIFWTNAWSPTLRPWIRSADVQGNVVMRMGTQQQQFRDNQPYFSIKNIFCDPSLEPSWLDGSNEG